MCSIPASACVAKSSADAREIHRAAWCGVNDSPLVDPISVATLYSYISRWNSQFAIARNQTTNTHIFNDYNVKYANFTDDFYDTTK